MGAGAPRVWCERGHIKRHPANNVWGTFWRSLANCIHTSIYRVYCIKRARGGRAIGCPRHSIPPHTQCYMVRLNMCGARAICRWVSAHAESAKRELGIGASNNGYIIYTLYCVICMVLVYMFVRSRAWSCFIYLFQCGAPRNEIAQPIQAGEACNCGAASKALLAPIQQWTYCVVLDWLRRIRHAKPCWECVRALAMVYVCLWLNARYCRINHHHQAWTTWMGDIYGWVYDGNVSETWIFF